MSVYNCFCTSLNNPSNLGGESYQPHFMGEGGSRLERAGCPAQLAGKGPDHTALISLSPTWG